MRLILLAVLTLASYNAFADDESFNRFNNELTQALETDALSALTSGFTYEIEAKLCQRIEGDVGREFQTEYQAWMVRNDDYIKAAGQVMNEFGNQFIPHGGEEAKQSYLQGAFIAMLNAGTKRVSTEMDGANLDNILVPTAETCQNFAEGFRTGWADFKNIPEETAALLAFMNRTAKP